MCITRSNLRFQFMMVLWRLQLPGFIATKVVCMLWLLLEQEARGWCWLPGKDAWASSQIHWRCSRGCLCWSGLFGVLEREQELPSWGFKWYVDPVQCTVCDCPSYNYPLNSFLSNIPAFTFSFRTFTCFVLCLILLLILPMFLSLLCLMVTKSDFTMLTTCLLDFNSFAYQKYLNDN